MYDNSRYRLIMKSEQRKVRAIVGGCTYSQSAPSRSPDDELLLIAANSDRSRTNSCGCGRITNTGGANAPYSAADRLACDFQRNAYDEYYRRAAFNDIVAEEYRENAARSGRRGLFCRRRHNDANTNRYLFANQSFINNALGVSNVNISKPHDNNRAIRREIRDILGRYGRRSR